ncbi:hypothetical protein BGX33_000616 [Mortierella sp. NVP41]|nr:hypothetical protein BGX33_000616 [Mortierella sp. NVP41]
MEFESSKDAMAFVTAYAHRKGFETFKTTSNREPPQRRITMMCSLARKYKRVQKLDPQSRRKSKSKRQECLHRIHIRSSDRIHPHWYISFAHLGHNHPEIEGIRLSKRERTRLE